MHGNEVLDRVEVLLSNQITKLRLRTKTVTFERVAESHNITALEPIARLFRYRVEWVCVTLPQVRTPHNRVAEILQHTSGGVLLAVDVDLR